MARWEGQVGVARWEGQVGVIRWEWSGGRIGMLDEMV